MSAQTDYTLADLEGAKDERKVLARCQYLLKCAKAPDKRWRKKGREGVRFYFDDQWEADAKQTVEERGQQPIVMNGIKPTVKIILGLMLAQPMEWLAKPVGGNDDDLSGAASTALKYVANRNHMPSVLKRVYWWALTYGVGWVMVGPRVRTKRKGTEPVQIRVIDPREIRLDPQSVEPDLSDARFIVWSRKVDIEDARKLYPKSAALAGQVGGSDANLSDKDSNTGGVTVNPGLVGVTPPPSLWDTYSDWNQDENGQDVDKANKQVVIHELYEYEDRLCGWYVGQDGTEMEFDWDDEDMRASLLQNPAVVKVWQEPTPKVMKRTFCGPLLLENEPYDRKHNRFPFLPCFFERDEHGDPVSFVESLKQTQREVNYRRAKMLHALGNPAMRVSQSVLSAMGMDHIAFAKHIATPGAVVIAEAGQVEAINKPDAASQQFDLMMHGETSMQKAGGTNDHMMGYDGPAESGKSKEISLAQGATMQRDSETNLRDFHKHLGELTLSDIQQEHTGMWVVRITDEVGSDKWLTLNEPQADPQTGLIRNTRDLASASMEIEVENSPFSPTVRARAAQEIGQMAAAEENPIKRAALHKIQITVSDYPQRAKILKALEEADQAAAQPQPPQQRESEQVRINSADMTPYEIGQLLQKDHGLQPDPARQPGQPSASQMKAQGAPAAPPTLDPNKVLDAHTKVTVASIKHAHDAQQGAIGRTHDELMALANQEHAHGLAHANHTRSMQAGQMQHEMGLAAATHAADLEPDPLEPGEATEPGE